MVNAQHAGRRAIGSWVNRSSSTFESTSVPAGGGLLVATGERHDLVDAHGDRATPAHPPYDRLSCGGLDAHQPCAAAIDLEVDFGARLDPQLASHHQRNRHLSFACHTIV